MLAFIAALLPVFALIIIGQVMYRRDFPGAAFWPFADRLVYFICFPALLVFSIGNGKFRDAELGPLALTVVGSVLLLSILLWLLRPWLAKNGPAFTSLFQGSVRFNTFVGLGVVAALHGSTGVALFALITGIIVPIINVMCVTTLARFGTAGGGPATMRQVAGLIARNPLIIACLIGMALNVSGIGMPPLIGPVFDILGRIALPLGLLTVGAGLDLGHARTIGRELPLACLFKFVIMPLSIAGLATLTSLDGVSREVALIWAVMPTASSAYILSRQLGGDSPLMAAIITAETLLAFVAAPVVFTVLG